MKNRFFPSLAAAFVALTMLPATAGGHDGVKAEVDILPGWRAENGAHMAGLRIVLAPGWKTYWRAPGEAGLPPKFDWSASENLAGVQVLWPAPEVFASNGMTTLGFHDEVILPLELSPIDPGEDIRLDGALAMGICEEICMPIQTEVSAVLPSERVPVDPRIKTALDRRPDTTEEAGVISARCSVEPIADGLRVTAKIDMPPLGAGEFTVIETPREDIWVSEAITRRAQNMLTATADLVPPDARPFDLDPEDLRLTVLTEGRAVDIRGCTQVR